MIISFFSFYFLVNDEVFRHNFHLFFLILWCAFWVSLSPFTSSISCVSMLRQLEFYFLQWNKLDFPCPAISGVSLREYSCIAIFYDTSSLIHHSIHILCISFMHLELFIFSVSALSFPDLIDLISLGLSWDLLLLDHLPFTMCLVLPFNPFSFVPILVAFSSLYT